MLGSNLNLLTEGPSAKKKMTKYRLKDQKTWERLCAFPGFEKAFQEAMEILMSRTTGSRVNVLFRFSPATTSILCFPLVDVEEVKEETNDQEH